MQSSSASLPDPMSGNPSLPAAFLVSPPGRKQNQLNRLRKSLSERKRQASLKDDGSPSSNMEIDDVSQFRGVDQFAPSIKQLQTLELETSRREDRPTDFLDRFGSASTRLQTDMLDEKKRLMPVVKQQVVDLHTHNPKFKEKTEGKVAAVLATAPTHECAKLMMSCMLLNPKCESVRPGGRNDWKINLKKMGVKVSCEFDDFDKAFDCPMELFRVALPSGYRSLWGSLMERNKPHPPTSSSTGKDSLTTTLAAFLVSQEQPGAPLIKAELKDLAETFVDEFYSESLRLNADWLLEDFWPEIVSKMDSFKASLNCKASRNTEVTTKYEQIIECIEDEIAKQEACRASKAVQQEPNSFEILARQTIANETKLISTIQARDKDNHELAKQRMANDHELEKQRMTNDHELEKQRMANDQQRMANDQADKIRQDEAIKRRDEGDKRRDDAMKEMVNGFTDAMLTMSGQKRPREEASMAHAPTTAYQIPCSPAPSAAAVTANPIRTPSAATVTFAAPASLPPTAPLTNPTNDPIRTPSAATVTFAAPASLPPTAPLTNPTTNPIRTPSAATVTFAAPASLPPTAPLTNPTTNPIRNPSAATVTFAAPASLPPTAPLTNPTTNPIRTPSAATVTFAAPASLPPTAPLTNPTTNPIRNPSAATVTFAAPASLPPTAPLTNPTTNPIRNPSAATVTFAAPASLPPTAPLTNPATTSPTRKRARNF